MILSQRLNQLLSGVTRVASPDCLNPWGSDLIASSMGADSEPLCDLGGAHSARSFRLGNCRASD